MNAQPSSLDDVVADPTRRYTTPFQVLNDQDISRETKRRILESWKVDAELLSTATNENMTGGEPALPLLWQVNVALVRLGTT